MNFPLNWEFLQWHLSPVALQLGPLAVRWYGLMYAVAFGVSYYLVAYRLKSEDWADIRRSHIDDALTWMVVGVLLGGRLGYVLFYGWSYFSLHPLEIVFPFRIDGGLRFIGISGMSYHGGLIGFTVAVLLFCKRRGLSPARFADLIVPAIPLGYAFGRVGNFINGELWGRIASIPWAMRFPMDPAGDAARGMLPPLRHPSQLYEAAGEGLLLWIILWTFRNHSFFRGRTLAAYLVGYGAIRFLIEYTREPDAQLGLVLGPFSMGQILCTAMATIGMALFLASGRKRPLA